MLETNISQLEARKKYSKDFIYYRRRVGRDENSDVCDVIFVGKEGEIAQAKKTHTKEDGFIYGVTWGIHTGPSIRGVRVKWI